MFKKKFLNKGKQISSEIKEVIESNVQNKNENQIKKKNKDKLMRENIRLKKNSNLDIHQKEGFQTFSEIPDSKIFGGESYQTSPKDLKNFQILKGDSYLSWKFKYS